MTTRRAALGLGVAAVLGVAGGWGTIRRVEGRERAAEAAFPPEGRVVEAMGRRVHAVQRGDGPDVVLLHGALGSSRDMTFALVDRLAQRVRVTAFDRPGSGWTDAADGDGPEAQAALLRAAAKMFGIERAVVVGHSFGASVAVAWALGDPRGTAGLVTLAGLLVPWEGPDNPLFAVLGSGAGGAVAAPLLAAFAPEAAAQAAMATVFAPDPVPEGYAEHVGAALSLRRASLGATAGQVLALRPALAAMAAELPTLALPVEVVNGTADDITEGMRHAKAFAALVPGAQVTALPGVGHMPHHADPDAVVAAILRMALPAGG